MTRPVPVAPSGGESPSSGRGNVDLLSRRTRIDSRIDPRLPSLTPISSPTQAREYARKPKRIGSRVYANRMGNGDEASGEGYRYRGRGLIQLTGTNNYRGFANWLGEDVVANPDLVSDKYAVHSAVYFWTENNINALADLDDVRLVTRRINGGLNGLAERMQLLEEAKKVLGVDVQPIALEKVTHTVTATQLNLRSRPKVSASNWLGTLAEGSEVMKLGDAAIAGWFRIRTLLNGQPVEGFVASRFLKRVRRAAPTPTTIPTVARPESIAPAHMRERRRDITRERDGGRAYPLGEAGMPSRKGGTAQTKVRSLLEVIGYLNSENHRHLRYQPKGSTTYCNIYAYDFCYLTGAYLPRVWWTERALREIREGGEVEVKYGDTVRELNANMLHDWLEDYGPSFGWQRLMNLDTLQAAANKGDVCVIVAQRTDLNRSGHIAAVVPEGEGFAAVRNSAGEVTRPLQSQAGRTNFQRSSGPGIWWRGSQFRSFGLWRHG